MWISARKRSKWAAKRLVFAFWEQEGVPNRKKVAKKSEFLFLRGADRPSGADSAKDACRAADLAQDARYRGDGDEASFRERDKQLIAFLSALPAVFSDSNSWFKVIAPLLMSGASGLSTLIRAAATGFLLFGEQCMLCRIACKKIRPRVAARPYCASRCTYRRAG